MIVSTVMSNLGFYKALETEGIQSNKTKVEIDMSLKK